MFPSLVNCCTIDWFTEWPEDALEKVATKFLEDMDMDDEVFAHCLLFLLPIFCAIFSHSRFGEIVSKCVGISMKAYAKPPFDICLK